MLSDEQFIETIVVSIRSLDRNEKMVTTKNIKLLLLTFLKARFDNKPLRELTEAEQIQLCDLISRWKFYNKPTLIVDNTK